MIVSHTHLMSKRLKIEIASNTSPVFLPHCFIWALKKKNCFNYILLCRGKKTQRFVISPFYVFLILSEQQRSKMAASSRVSLGQVETAYAPRCAPCHYRK